MQLCRNPLVGLIMFREIWHIITTFPFNSKRISQPLISLCYSKLRRNFKRIKPLWNVRVLNHYPDEITSNSHEQRLLIAMVLAVIYSFIADYTSPLSPVSSLMLLSWRDYHNLWRATDIINCIASQGAVRLDLLINTPLIVWPSSAIRGPNINYLKCKQVKSDSSFKIHI